MPTSVFPRALVPLCIETEVKPAREINGKEDSQLYFWLVSIPALEFSASFTCQ